MRNTLLSSANNAHTAVHQPVNQLREISLTARESGQVHEHQHVDVRCAVRLSGNWVGQQLVPSLSLPVVEMPLRRRRYGLVVAAGRSRNRPWLGSGPERQGPGTKPGRRCALFLVSQQWLRSSSGAPAGGGLVVLSMQGIALRYSYMARRSCSDMS